MLPQVELPDRPGRPPPLHRARHSKRAPFSSAGSAGRKGLPGTHRLGPRRKAFLLRLSQRLSPCSRDVCPVKSWGATDRANESGQTRESQIFRSVTTPARQDGQTEVHRSFWHRQRPLPMSTTKVAGAIGLLSLATFIVILDATIINVAIPHVAAALSASPSEATW